MKNYIIREFKSWLRKTVYRADIPVEYFIRARVIFYNNLESRARLIDSLKTILICLPHKIREVMRNSSQLKKLQLSLETTQKELNQKNLTIQDLEDKNFSLESLIKHYETDKLMIESLLKKKAYEIDELEKSHFLKLEEVKEEFLKKKFYFESLKKNEIEDLNNQMTK